MNFQFWSRTPLRSKGLITTYFLLNKGKGRFILNSDILLYKNSTRWIL